MTVTGKSGDPTPESPCIGVCLIDPATGYCRGCLRSVTEIASWYEASAVDKHGILARLDQRRLDRRLTDVRS
jgi:uncharacterized protein